MSLLNVPAGKDLPEDIYVVIEIPANADPIKYEIDKESGALFVDRFMSTAMFYPCNYGYINHTLSLDGDPVDVLVPTPYPLQPGSVIRCRPVGVQGYYARRTYLFFARSKEATISALAASAFSQPANVITPLPPPHPQPDQYALPAGRVDPSSAPDSPAPRRAHRLLRNVKER